MTVRGDRESGIRELHAEAGGVLQLLLVTTADALRLIAAAATGDREAAAYLWALDTCRRRIEGAAADAPDCLICGRRLGADTPRLALLIPGGDDASRCLVVGLCPTCAGRHQDRAGAATAIVAALQSQWQELRPIASPSGPAGRA